MKTEIAAMALLFTATLVTGVVGLVLLPPPWPTVFGTLAGVAGLGLLLAGYATRTAVHSSANSASQQSDR